MDARCAGPELQPAALRCGAYGMNTTPPETKVKLTLVLLLVSGLLTVPPPLMTTRGTPLVEPEVLAPDAALPPPVDIAAAVPPTTPLSTKPPPGSGVWVLLPPPPVSARPKVPPAARAAVIPVRMMPAVTFRAQPRRGGKARAGAARRGYARPPVPARRRRGRGLSRIGFCA